MQDSAYPYHDWNERITAECYAPNAAARILNSENLITDIVNNYESTSFNFGPTLLSWLQAYAPKVYAAILDADKKSAERFSGHGSAIAQAYNHMILPLADAKDRRSQVIWGIRDFEHRFGRKPDGMWLPETAVDMETLDVFAQHGIKFSALAPRQAKRVRRRAVAVGKTSVIHPSHHAVPRSPTRSAFHQPLLYDGPISRSIAFEGLLSNGSGFFAERLLGAFSDQRTWPEIVDVALPMVKPMAIITGHGEMALSYALHYIQLEGR